MVLVSACLAGEATRYDGRHCLERELMKSLGAGTYIAFCPEVLGGLSIPRLPAALQGGRQGREGMDLVRGKARLVDATGRDVSGAFLRGARRVVSIARAAAVTRAYLKDRSPSCGHDPRGENPRGGPGQGVLTALLLAEGIECIEVRAACTGGT